MIYNEHKSTIRSIKQGDPGFYISDDYKIAGRSGLVISADCPSDIAFVVRQAMSNKWITMVANVKDSELMWEELNR